MKKTKRKARLPAYKSGPGDPQFVYWISATGYVATVAARRTK